MLQQRHAARDAERAALAAEDEKRRKAALYLGELQLDSELTLMRSVRYASSSMYIVVWVTVHTGDVVETA
jgi:hypothetical protein